MVSIAVGAVVHLEEMQLARVRQLFAIKGIRFAEDFGGLEQGIHEDIGHMDTLAQVGLHLLGNVPEWMHLVEVVLQAVNVVLVQVTQIVLGQMDHLVVGHGEQLNKEVPDSLLQVALDTANSSPAQLAIAVRIVGGVNQMAKGEVTQLELNFYTRIN